MEKYDLMLRQADDILPRFRNLNLVAPNVGFLIELRVHKVLEDNHQTTINRTQNRPNYFCIEAAHLLSLQGMSHFLDNILFQAEVCVGSEGRLNEFKLGRHNMYPSSIAIRDMRNLAEMTCHYLRNLMLSGFVSLVPIAIDLRITNVEHQEFGRQEFFHLDNILILRDFSSISDIAGDGNRIGSLQREANVERQDFRRREFVRLEDTLILGDFSSISIIGGDDNETNLSRRVTKVKEVRIEDRETNCSICLEVLFSGQIAGQLPCSHTFHKNCIGRWLKNNYTCPLCRAPADVNV